MRSLLFGAGSFLVDLPNRGSFSPDTAFHPGPLQGRRFMDGAPEFAVEVCGEDDYGSAVEREMADKCAGYLAAGTLVVWDVDALRERPVRVYCAGEPDRPTVYRSGDMAEAEPALPGWTMPVADLLP